MNRRQLLAYLMAPVSPSNGRTLAENIATAKAWLSFLRALTRGMGLSIICPWLASILAGADESSAEEREQGLLDDCTTAARCDLVIAVGYSPTDDLTSGMLRERAACPGPCIDLMHLGSTWAFPVSMSDSDRAEILMMVRAAMRAVNVDRLRRWGSDE